MRGTLRKWMLQLSLQLRAHVKRKGGEEGLQCLSGG